MLVHAGELFAEFSDGLDAIAYVGGMGVVPTRGRSRRSILDRGPDAVERNHPKPTSACPLFNLAVGQLRKRIAGRTLIQQGECPATIEVPDRLEHVWVPHRQVRAKTLDVQPEFEKSPTMPSKNLAAMFRGTCAACALFLPSCMTEPADEVASQDNKADTTSFSVNASSVEVTKTAFIDGQDVCGTIHIMNVGENPATLSDVADSLEVHFPGNVTPPPLPAGSTP